MLCDWSALEENDSLLIFHAESSLPDRGLLLDNAGHFLVVTILCDTHGRVNLPLHSLKLTLSLHKVPIRRLICLVGYFLGPLVRLSIVIRVEDVSVVDGQSSRFLLSQVFILILINLNLSLDLLESTRVHLRGCHESAHPTLEIQLLDALRWNVLVLLLNFGLHVSRQLLHVRKDFNLPRPVL